MSAVIQETTSPPATSVTHERSVGQSVTRGALALLSTQPLTWAATLAYTIMLPRLLGSTVYGEREFAITLSQLASTITGLGISEYLVRRAAQHPQSLRFDQGVALLVQCFTAVLGFTAIALAGGTLGAVAIDRSLLLVACIPLLAAPAQTVLLSTFRGREKHRQYAWLNATYVVLNTAAVLLVLLLGGDVVAATAAGGLAAAVGILLAWKLSGFRPYVPRLDRATLQDSMAFVRAGLGFVSWQLTQMAYSQIDRVLLGLLVPVSQVGWYAAANRIIGIPIFIPTLIVTPLFPALSRSAQSPEVLRRSIVQTLRMTLLLTVPLSAGTIVVAPVVPVLLGWPDDFVNAVLPMSLLAAQLPLVSAGMVLGAVLMAIGRERRMVVVATVATVFNICLNLLAIPLVDRMIGNGGVGAAIVTVASEIVMLLGAVFFIPKQILDWRILGDALRIVTAGVATALVGSALLPIALPLAVAGGAVTYVVVAVVVRVLTRDDMQLMLRYVRR